MEDHVIGRREELTTGFQIRKADGKISYRYSCLAEAVFGLGERFCSVNHKGRTLVNQVFEQFTRQKEHTYFPLPFYHASDGHGVFVDTLCEVTFHFEEEENRIEIAQDAPHTLYFYYGSPGKIIADFVKATGKAVLPPKWAFGVWASANRWNCQRDIEEQLTVIEREQYPVSVMVIEAWSDEATFYIWNGAEYQPVSGAERFALQDFAFREPWPDPAGMIRRLHDLGIKVVLWQIPALKQMEKGEKCSQHQTDCTYAKEAELVIKNKEGQPYRIPRQWFIGAMIPDFSNRFTVEWWKEKRRYLLEEMQVDGFKTDGGEFIHVEEVAFQCGYDGKEGRNVYPVLYEQAYREMTGEERVLFSRAGYLGAQKTPIHWAGDQVSTFEELQDVFHAGLSLSLSGIPFWSFDIAGFAGPLPDKELYLRATAFAAFVPAMQWHSEPAGGQFAEIMKGSGGVNDRSPWNMAEAYQDKSILETARFFANLHMNFLPYFYQEAKRAVEENQPFMRHLALDYEQDRMAVLCEDEYMIGDLLVAPVVIQGAEKRSIYLPPGNWYDLWNGFKIKGGCSIERLAALDRIPLFVRESGTLLLQLNELVQLGGYVGNQAEENQNLSLIFAGEEEQHKERRKTSDLNIIPLNEFVKMQMDGQGIV